MPKLTADVVVLRLLLTDRTLAILYEYVAHFGLHGCIGSFCLHVNVRATRELV